MLVLGSGCKCRLSLAERFDLTETIINQLLADSYQNPISGSSLVVQWLRIRLPVQGTRVRALVREDPTCRGATKPVCHNYLVCSLDPASRNCRSPCAWSPCSTAREASSVFTAAPHRSHYRLSSASCQINGGIRFS